VKCIFDGICDFTLLDDTVDNFCKYFNKVNKIYYSLPTGKAKLLYIMDNGQRKYVHDITFNSSLRDLYFSDNDFYSDTFIIGSPLISYFVERILTYDKPYMSDLAKSILDDMIKEYKSNTTLNILMPEKEQDYYMLKYMHKFYTEAYAYLRNHPRRKFHINMCKPDVYYTYLRNLNNTVNKISLVYPHTIVLDIDGVLVDFDEESTKFLQKLDSLNTSNERYFDSYFKNGRFNENVFLLQTYINTIRRRPGYEFNKYNLVILSARSKIEDKAFLEYFKGKIYQAFYNCISSSVSYLNPKVHFDPDKNILSTSYEEFKGATLFKGYSLNVLNTRINQLFKNKSNGIIFIDDRVKYSQTAFHNFSFSYDDSLSKREIEDSALSLKRIHLGDNIVYVTERISSKE